MNFIIPIVVLLLIGMLYVMTQRADTHFANFVLIGAGAITAIYWISVIKKMAKQVVVPKFNAREAEAKNWVYDLIKGEDEIVFVAEVPGPDDKIMVRLIDGILYVRGSSRFSKEIPIEGSSQMQITDFKYRNGVLTLKIS
uniref:Hsp20/alpha crystallin family protein n=1 Tax=uncultured marine thaumarchaeote KM3_46_E07 TaxID=1456159 RepID=A0A075H5W5_9ARCH|nr:hypothetical protein [uncultured marine thaumarchaeote KM3_46_E07]